MNPRLLPISLVNLRRLRGALGQCVHPVTAIHCGCVARCSNSDAEVRLGSIRVTFAMCAASSFMAPITDMVGQCRKRRDVPKGEIAIQFPIED
jgi:hypothetical protein